MTNEDYIVKWGKWMHLVPQVEALKAEEMALRKELADHLFPDAPTEGSTTIKLTEGFSLQLDRKITRTCENKKGETNSVFQQLPPELANDTFKFSPSLKMTGYKKLPQVYRTLVDSVITSKPGAPSLKLIPPKVVT